MSKGTRGKVTCEHIWQHEHLDNNSEKWIIFLEHCFLSSPNKCCFGEVIDHLQVSYKENDSEIYIPSPDPFLKHQICISNCLLSISPHGQLISTSKLTGFIPNFWYSLIFPTNLLTLPAPPSQLLTIPAIHLLKPKLLEPSLTLFFLSYHMDKPLTSRFVSTFKIYPKHDYFSTPPLLP